MAAPAPTARQTPVGLKLRDGYQALITLEVDPDISFWEKQVQPPGIEGGEPIPQTTMHNEVYRTQAPRSLKTVTSTTHQVAYDPVVTNQVVAIINQPTTITVTWSDGSTVAYFGYLRSFIPASMQEGVQPEAAIVIEPTNEDWENDYVEAGYSLTSVVGT